MLLRALLFVSVAWLLACGPTPLTQEEICGPGGCDVCIGFTCAAPDAGVP